MSDLAWGLQMSVLGMGLVFGLLALLWGLLTLVRRLDRSADGGLVTETDAAASSADVEALAADAVAALADSAPTSQTANEAPPQVQGMDAELVAAILVATLRHRAILRREAAPATRRYWPGSMLVVSRWVGAGRSRQNSSWQRRSR